MKPPINADERRLNLNKITEKIIGCVHQVSNTLGIGFLEKVYENALTEGLRESGLEADQQRRIEVRYKNKVVGDFVADLVVDGCIIVEVKAVKSLDEAHTAQCINYLKATGFQVCLLVNFGTAKAVVKRIVHEF